MQEPAKKIARPHTELRRQDQRAAKAAEAGTEVPKLKPRSPDDRVPGGDEDDLFNDMPV